MQAVATSFGQWKGKKSLHEPRIKRGTLRAGAQCLRGNKPTLGGFRQLLLYLAITSWTSEHSPPPKFRSSLRLLLRGQFGIYSGSLGTQVEQLTFSSITWGLAWAVGGREKRMFAQSHSRMNREAWAAGLGRPGASEQLDFPQSAGKQLSHFQASGKEEAKVVSTG